MTRPNSVFGLTKELIRARWRKLGLKRPTWKTLIFGGLIIAAMGTAVAVSSMSCPASSGGCPYSSASR